MQGYFEKCTKSIPAYSCKLWKYILTQNLFVVVQKKISYISENKKNVVKRLEETIIIFFYYDRRTV